MIVESSAPTRIDLAGGTLDLWPLHLFFHNPPTLNAAIDLYARVTMKTRRDRALVIESQDLGIKEKFPSINRLPEDHPLELILRLLQFYKPATGLDITTHCQAPAGSGIGGSSALNIALNGAFNRLTGSRYRRETLIEIAKNIETQVIDVPAGIQDYYSALNGGAQSIQPGFDRIRAKSLPLNLKLFTSHFVLCYTGKPRASGINNWQVFKDVVDQNQRTRRQLGAIAETSVAMKQELIRGSLKNFADLFDAEWRARKKLSPGISTPEMDALIRTGKQHGALAAKVCGAGGGGCVAFFVKSDFREAVASALESKGGRVLPFRFVKRGLVVSVRKK